MKSSDNEQSSVAETTVKLKMSELDMIQIEISEVKAELKAVKDQITAVNHRIIAIEFVMSSFAKFPHDEDSRITYLCNQHEQNPNIGPFIFVVITSLRDEKKDLMDEKKDLRDQENALEEKKALLARVTAQRQGVYHRSVCEYRIATTISVCFMSLCYGYAYFNSVH